MKTVKIDDFQPKKSIKTVKIDDFEPRVNPKYSKTINFGTLNSDMSTLGDSIKNAYSNWQSSESLKKTKADVQSMYNRLTALQEYNQFMGNTQGQKELADTISAYKGVLDDFDEIVSYYGNYKNEDAYKKALKAIEESEKMKTADLSALQSEIDEIKSEKDLWVKRAQSEIKSKIIGTKSLTSHFKGYDNWVIPNSNTENDSKYSGELKGIINKKNLLTAVNENTEADKSSKYAGYSISELEELIKDKESYLKLAEWVQKGVKLASVADENSKYYDKNFESYVQKGNNTSYNEVGKMKVAGTQATIDDERAAAIALNAYNSKNKDNLHILNQFTNFKFYYDWLEDNEYDLIAYYIAKDKETGGNELGEYLKSIEETLNSRKAGETFEKIKGKTALELLYGIPAGLNQFASGIENLFNTSDEYIPANSTQQVSGMIREDLADDGPEILGHSLGQIGYDFITTTSNMTPSILASAVTNAILPGSGAVVGAALMGGSAAGNSYQEKLNLGWSKKEARIYSTIVGVSEAGLSYALSGISKLGGKLSGKAITSIANSVDSAAAKFVTIYGGNILSEVTEESLQEILNPFFENIALGYSKNNFSDIDWGQVAYAGVLAALSAGLLEFKPSLSQSIKESKMAKFFNNVPSNIKDFLIEKGLEFNKNSEVYNLSQKYNFLNKNGGKVSGTQMSKLFESIVKETNKSSESINEWASVYESLKFEGYKFPETLNNSYETISESISTNKNIREDVLGKFMLGVISYSPINMPSGQLQNFIDSASGNGYNIGRGEGYDNEQRTVGKEAQELQAVNTGRKIENGRAWEEDEESFTRRAQEDVLGVGGEKRRVLKLGNSQISYVEKSADNSNAGRAVKRFEDLGVKAVLCDGDIETNQNGITTSHSEAVTAPDGTVYVSSNATLSDIEIVSHEIVHSHKKKNSQAYIDYESVVCENILFNSEACQEIFSQINENHFGGKYDITDIENAPKFINELTAYINEYVVTNPQLAEEMFSGMFEDWKAVVEAAEKFNNDIGADFSESVFSSPEGEEIQKPSGEIYELSKNILPSTENKVERKKLTLAEKQTVREVGKALDVRVEFFSVEQYAKENSVSIDKAPNSYEENGILYIAESVVDPLSFCFGHEFVESIINKYTSTNEKGELVIDNQALEIINNVMDSDLFTNYVKTQGFNSSLEYSEWIVKNRVKKGDPNFVDKRSNEQNIRAQIEAVANFFGAKCSSDINGLKDFANRMNGKQRNRFIQFVKDLIAGLKAKLQSLTGDRKAIFDYEFLRIERELSKLYKESKSKPDDSGKHFSHTDKNKNTADSGVDSENIIDISNDNELSKRIGDLRGAEKYKIIQDYILEVLGEQTITLSDGKKAIVDNRDALHIANKAANKKTAQISQIKKIVENAVLYAEDNNVVHNKFDYFCYYVAIANYGGEKFKIYLNIGKSKNDGKYHIYDITNKLRDTADRINGLERPKPNEGYALTNDVSNNSISNSDEKVNDNNSQKHFSYPDSKQNAHDSGKHFSFEDNRKSEKGELINDFYYALDKPQWKRYYDYIAENGYLCTSIGDTLSTVTDDKLILSERVKTSDKSNDFQVYEVYRIKGADSFEMHEIKRLVDEILESGENYDRGEFEKRLYRIIKATGKEQVFTKFDRNNVGFDNSYTISREQRSIDESGGIDKTRTDRTGVQDSDKQIEQRISKDLEADSKESAFSTPENSQKHFSYPDTPSSLLDRYDNGEITREQMEEIISGKKKDNPKTIANLKPEDANTTPSLKRKQGKAEGNEISNTYESLLNSDIFDERFKEEVKTDEFIMKYQSVSNKETLMQAAKELDEGGQSYVNKWWVKDSQHASLIDTAVGFILMDRYQRAGDYESSIAVAEKIREIGTASGQQVQLFSILGRLDPNSMAVYAQKELSEMFEVLCEKRSKRWIDNNSERFKLTDEEIEFIRRRTVQAAMLPEGRDKAVKIAEICTLLQDKIPTNIAKRLRAFQRTSLLFNVRTNVRNITGNAGMVPVFITSDFFGSGIDKIVAKKTGVRTTGNFDIKSIKAMKKGAFESYDDFKRHINTRNSEADRFEIGEGKAFDENHKGILMPFNYVAKYLNAMDRLTSFCLDFGDRVFYEMWFTNSINNQLKLNKTTEVTPEMVKIATNEALERTWQNTNNMTKFVAGIKSNLNVINLAGYGLGDIFLKFTKTPANLTKAVYDFSPAALKTVASDARKLYNAIEKGQYDSQLQKNFVNSFSKAISGTLLYVGAFALASAGLISGAADEDKDVANFEKNILGIPPYSIKICGKWFSYEWMQPQGSILAIAADYMKSKQKYVDNEWYDDVLLALKSGGAVLYNQSFMQSLQNLFTADTFIDGIIEGVLDEPAAFLPQLLSQTANATDDYSRITFEYDKPFKTALNNMIAKIPGAREKLEKQVDVLGRDIKNSRSTIFKAYFDPTNTYTNTSNAVSKEVYSVYKQTGEKSVIPRVAPNYVTVKGFRYNFSSEEKADYQRISGSISSELLGDAIKTKEYKNLSDEEKVKFVTKIYDFAAASAKSNVDFDYETLSAMVGERSDKKPLLSKEKYNKLSDEARGDLAKQYFFTKVEYRLEDDNSALINYYLKKIMEEH